MKSEIRFAMHPQDEVAFVDEVLSDPSVVLVNGPRWKTATPPTTRDLSKISDDYCIIWSPAEFPRLAAEYIPTCKDWCCRSLFGTIQLLRSVMHNDSVLIEGRVAISTDNTSKQYNPQSAKHVEARYRKLRRYIKKTHTNSILSWCNVRLPETPDNPSKPDATTWVGPAALSWLRASKKRRVKQSLNSFVEGRLV